MPRLVALFIVVFGTASALGQDAKPKAPPKPPTAAQTTPAAAFKPLPGYEVELVYTVPKAEQGSWVCLCIDPKGRIVASDQYGALYRITPQPLGSNDSAKVEKLTVDIGMAQGLLYAFDALYVVVNDRKKAGLYRVTDTNNDDQPDKVELLRSFDGGGGEHGPHAVLPHPDGKRLTVVCGNQTKLTEVDTSAVPPVYGDDHLLPRLPDGNGFMAGVLAPGGYVCNVDPDGKNWELVSIGFRNQYDAAYDASGELFTYDADMEWDMNLPWYRPTRVCHVVPGSDWGWRNGAGKYREHYFDNLPPVVNIGVGSPTGVAFGYDAKFPAKYQKALFLCDWSYGKLYAVHLKPAGATYTAEFEEFLSGTPLPLTDLVVNPADGAMYFAVGGRRVQSGLYRVRYTGGESTAKVTDLAPRPTPEAKLRRRLERLLQKPDAAAVSEAWPHLSHPDRFIRSLARTILEHAKPEDFFAKAVAETEPQAALNALLAAVRTAAPCPLHVKGRPPVAGQQVEQIFAAITKIEPAKLSAALQGDYLRLVQVALHRIQANPPQQRQLGERVMALLPSENRVLNAEAVNLLAYLQHPEATKVGMALLADAPTQEEQIDYAMALRKLTAGWTPELRTQYMQWFAQAQNYKGGNSFQGYLKQIKADAVASLPEAERERLRPVIEAKPTAEAAMTKPRPFVKAWTLDELTPVVTEKLAAGNRDYDRGRKLFGQTSCFACHRYDNEGGNTGPDLSGVAGRFAPRELLESIIHPSKEISDQYEAVQVSTLDGRVVVGRIMNYNGENLMINVNGLNPNDIVQVNRADVETMAPSKVSMMPEGLLNTLTPDEVADLCAYLLSRGNRQGPMFKK